MSEDKQSKLKPASEETSVAAKKTEKPEVKGTKDKGAAGNNNSKEFGQRRDSRGNRPGGRGRGRGGRDDRAKDEFEQRLLEVARVTRVMAGGKRMNFRACVAIGDKKGSVGVGLGKGADVTIAVNKAVNKAKKSMVKVSMSNDTITHVVRYKLGAAKIVLKPAANGRGVIAGGVTRAILELAGVKNVSSKTLGTNNKVNNARCTVAALASLRRRDNAEDTKKGGNAKKKGGDSQDSKTSAQTKKSTQEAKSELKK